MRPSSTRTCSTAGGSVSTGRAAAAAGIRRYMEKWPVWPLCSVGHGQRLNLTMAQRAHFHGWHDMQQ
eukprot:7491919-Lingulodinium_polyedra.AAC.1